MAKILYFSTHEALEYDDLILFRDMGHTVFSLGVFCPAIPQKNQFRPVVSFGPELDGLVEIFNKDACTAVFCEALNTKLTGNFINQFDIIIAIQDIGFIEVYWNFMREKVVIWRTVGQAIEHHDQRALPYRDQGLRIVRWCSRETRAAVYIGQDAVIRAYKDPSEYGPWTGASGRILTFSNQYRQRYPIELGVFERIVSGLPCEIGGAGNEDIEVAVGLIPYERMQAKFNEARAYLYCHGSTVPYTLNFIEAWMTGIPFVGPSRNVAIHNIDMRYNEINEFITHGVDGYLFDTEGQARAICMELLADASLAHRIGKAGRDSAIKLFGKEKIMAEWSRFFGSLGVASPTPRLSAT